ncbi:MAG: hypothetical protein U1D30_02885 [Planctomycetota bacterium]
MSWKSAYGKLSGNRDGNVADAKASVKTSGKQPRRHFVSSQPKYP